jgi:hypothetical protein
MDELEQIRQDMHEYLRNLADDPHISDYEKTLIRGELSGALWFIDKAIRRHVEFDALREAQG